MYQVANTGTNKTSDAILRKKMAFAKANKYAKCSCTPSSVRTRAARQMKKSRANPSTLRTDVLGS